jgi:hypothetical protein
MLQLANTPLVSRAWRLMNLYTIRDSDSNLIPFVPNIAQRHFWNRRWNSNHVLKARKLGFSTFLQIENLDALLFTPGLTAGIIDFTLPDAKEKLFMLRTAYENLDNPELHPTTHKLGAIIKQTIPISGSTIKLEFANKSTIRCSTSLRGATPQRIHWSEAGKTAIWFPGKFTEIVNGALNSITPGNTIDIESTHEGGKAGGHYTLLRKTMKQNDDHLTPVDRRFHFFPWYLDPRYQLHQPSHPIRTEITQYFTDLSKQLNRTFTHSQVLWYDRKQDEQGHGMLKEFPSTPGEAFQAINDHAIYGKQMADLRASRRIIDFAPEPGYPLAAFWDLGLSDSTALWIVQPHDRAFLVLHWLETIGDPASAMPDHILRLERDLGRPISLHYLPHDAATRDRGTGLSYQQTLAQYGLNNTIIVPRTPDIWLGIGHVRDVLPHCWFHATHCDTPRDYMGEEHPSGIACLEGYSRDISPTSTTLREKPKHDAFSHSADAFRTFAEARHLNLLDRLNQTTKTTTPKIIRPPVRRR